MMLQVTDMLQTRINYTDFTKLRNDRNNKIEAAMCNKCDKIIRFISKRTLDAHRYLHF